VCNWTVLTVITERQSDCYVECFTVQHIECTESVQCATELYCQWLHKLLLYVRLHNNTAHLLYKYCTKCTICNWTVLTVITQKLLLHVQLHNSTAHLPYKYCMNCRICYRSVLTVITQKLLLHVQQHSRREIFKLMSSEVECSRLFETFRIYR